MIDLRLLRSNPQLIRDSLQARNSDVALVDTLLDLDQRHRSAINHFDSLRAQQKALGKQVATADADSRPSLLAQTKELAVAVKAAETEQNALAQSLRSALLPIPNLVSPKAPRGGEDDFVVIREMGTIPTYDFPVRDHIELGQLTKSIDTERGAKVSGARFAFLTGQGALLHAGLFQLALTQALSHGFTPMVPPTLVRPESMEGTGYLGEHSSEVYRLAEDDLYLVGTSEVPLAAYYSQEIIDLSAGAQRFVGWSTCYRREAGSYGKDTRGIIRVHQFDKLEMFSFCDMADAEQEHERILAWEEEFLTALELPYRVIDVASGDLGVSAIRKFDCEVWFPSQQQYREVTSTSNCIDFQARRLNIRHRREDGQTQHVATLNGTLVAIGRMIAAVMEVYQQSDGTVAVPSVLQPYLGGRQLLELA